MAADSTTLNNNSNNIEDKKKQQANAATKDLKDQKPLSDADQKLKDDIELIFARMKDSSQDISLAALNQLKELIASSSVLMASVPKSLKFIKPFYEELKNLQSLAIDKAVAKEIADILSSLSIVMGETGDTLKYFTAGSQELTESHSQEFVHHLVMDITNHINNDKATVTPDLSAIISLIVKFQMSHNSEIDACDFLIEIEELDMIYDFIDHQTIAKVSEYLDRCAYLSPDYDSYDIMQVNFTLNSMLKCYPRALHAAIRLNSQSSITEVLKSCTDKAVTCQMLFMLADLQININFEEIYGSEPDETFLHIYSNTNKSKTFLDSAKELDILASRSLDDLLKKKIDFPKLLTANDTSSDKKYLSLTQANNFVNCAFGSDTIFTTSDCFKWLDNLQTSVITSSVASTGYLYLWNLDQGLNFVNQFLNHQTPVFKAGGLIAAGIIGTSVKDEFDSVVALVSEELTSNDLINRKAALVSLGIAYTGTNSEDVLNLILPHLLIPEDEAKSVDYICIAALSAAMVSIGTANKYVASSITRTLLQYPAKGLQSKHIDILSLALGLVYATQTTASENIIESLQILDDPIKSNAIQFVTIMAYAGSGNVEKILDIARTCIDVDEDKYTNKDSKTTTDDAKSIPEEDEEKQEETNVDEKSPHFKNKSLAVIGMALIAMGEKVGSEMMIRLLSQMIRYGDAKVKSAIPLAIGLLNVSQPSIGPLQMLTKLSHDSDDMCSKNAIIALGLVSAGTNNAKYSQTMRQLRATNAAQKDMSIAYVVNMALGLCHLGKGSLSLSPMRHENLLVKLTSLGSLATFAVCALHQNDCLYGHMSYLTSFLAPAISSKFLNTYNATSLEKLPTSVRVGAPLDTVGMAGKHRKVTGFQTHTTPVAFACDERAELVSDDLVSLSPYLEGDILLAENDEKMQIDN